MRAIDRAVSFVQTSSVGRPSMLTTMGGDADEFVTDLDEFMTTKAQLEPDESRLVDPTRWWTVYEVDFPLVKTLATLMLTLQAASLEAKKTERLGSEVFAKHKGDVSSAYADKLAFIFCNNDYGERQIVSKTPL